MATYAVGDVQGCFRTFERLLARCRWDPRRDRLWLTGDLVNRGPRSLEMLRWAAAHDRDIVSVLGNHDLHLLAVAAAVHSRRPKDTLDEVLASADREALVDWLRRRPLLHRGGEHVLVHAGIHPAWTFTEAEARAREVEEALRGEHWRAFIEELFEERPREPPRRRATVDAFTRMRACRVDGAPDLSFKDAPARLPPGLLPWFAVPDRASRDATIVFGHWAALGLHIAPGILALDTGCVWGGCLTAVRLEDGAVCQEPLADGPPAEGEE